MPATPIFAPGYPNKTSFAPTATGTYTDINITGWDKSLKIDSGDTSHSGSGGVEERIGELLRGTFSFNLNFDLANYYFSTTPGVTAGTKGTLRHYVSATKFWQFPVMILEETSKSIVAGKVEVTCSAGLDSSQGSIVRPV